MKEINRWFVGSAATVGLVFALMLASGCVAARGKCGRSGACGTGACGKKAAACRTCPKAGGHHLGTEAVITTDGLKALLDAKTTVTVVDARGATPGDGQRIPGAAALTAQSPADEVAKVLPDKGALIVTYCGSLKCPASQALATRLRKDGYTNVIEYPWGIAGWTKAGHPVEKSQE